MIRLRTGDIRRFRIDSKVAEFHFFALLIQRHVEIAADVAGVQIRSVEQQIVVDQDAAATA